VHSLIATLNLFCELLAKLIVDHCIQESNFRQRARISRFLERWRIPG